MQAERKLEHVLKNQNRTHMLCLDSTPGAKAECTAVGRVEEDVRAIRLLPSVSRGASDGRCSTQRKCVWEIMLFLARLPSGQFRRTERRRTDKCVDIVPALLV